MISYDKLTSLLNLEGKATPGPWFWQAYPNELDSELANEARNILRELILENLILKLQIDSLQSVIKGYNKLDREIIELKKENSLLKDKALYDVIKIN